MVNSYAHKGGASRAARRLQACLGERADVSVEFLSVLDGEFAKDNGLFLSLKKILNRLPGYLLSRGTAFFSTPMISYKRLVEYINLSDCDIVNLHWVNSGVLTVEDIARIRKPIVWSLHDMWAFTGGCHYSQTCVGYRAGCNEWCEVIGNRFGKFLSSEFFRKKRTSFEKCSSLNLVGLSRWMAAEAKSSSLAEFYSVVNLPNPIDIDVFRPLEKVSSRNRLSLPITRKLLLFGAMSPFDKRKGLSQLLQALNSMSGVDFELVMFGKADSDLSELTEIKIHMMGSIGDDDTLVHLYSAADAVIVPSLQENLSNLIMESMACGTPVIAFDIGGNSDMVDHMLNGYLAKPLDIHDLAAGIKCVFSENHLLEFSLAARAKVVDEFCYEVVSEKYMQLFKAIITGYPVSTSDVPADWRTK